MSIHESNIRPGWYREPTTGREINVTGITADSNNPDEKIVHLEIYFNGYCMETQSMPLSEFSKVGRFVRMVNG